MKSLFAMLGLWVCTAAPIQARGVVVSPSQLGLIGRAGSTVSDAISVSSSREEENQVQVSTSDFVRNEDGTIREISSSEAVRSCRQWLEVDQNFFTSPGTGRVELKVTARIPGDAAGSYWALLILKSLPPPRTFAAKADSGATLRIVPRVAIPVIVSVAGTEKRDVRLLETRVEKADSTGMDVSALVENRGNVAVLLNGAFTLETVSSESTEVVEVAETSFGAQTSMPGTRLRIAARIPWHDELSGLQLNAVLRYGPGAGEITQASSLVRGRVAPPAPKPPGM